MKKKTNSENFIYMLAGLVFLAGIFLLIFFSWQYFFQKNYAQVLIDNQTTEKITEIKCDYQRLLDGVCVDSAEKINPKIVAVMIENHSEARPQSGLVDASIVYEAPVEANYTRFLAIYPTDAEVKKVGPVRSARPYYLDWITEYGTPMYMHCGGSPEALELIKKNNIFDLNEFYNGWYYWRADDRSAPHNVYTSSELWSRALDKEGNNIVKENYEGWSFVTTTLNHSTTQPLDHTASGVGSGGEVVRWSGGQVTVSFLPPVYEAVWKYNTSTNQYARYQMNKPHCDADGKCIVADDVIIQKVKAKVIDEIGRQEITTIGHGEAIVFKDGIDYLGTWVKENKNSRTRFYDLSGEEIKLNPGKIWIEIVNGNGKIKY